MRTRCVGIGLLAGLLLAGGCSQWISKRAMERGLLALRQGDFPTAVKQLDKAAHHAKETDAPTVYYNLGIAHFNLNELEPALKAFRTALELAPSDRETMVYIGNIHLKRQEWSEATGMFERAGQGRPPDAQLLSALAQAANGVGHVDEARVDLIRALHADRTYATAFYDLGELYAGKYMLPAEAVENFEIFVRMADPKDPHITKAKAGILRLKNVIGRFAPPMPAGMKRDPAVAVKLTAEGDRQRAAHQAAKAEKASRDALAADPLCQDALYNLALFARGRNANPEALKLLVRATAIEPAHPATLFECAQTALVLKDYATAGRMLDRVIACSPEHALAYASLAVVRLAQGHPDQARVYAEQYVRLAPPGADRDRFEAWARSLPQP